jgi:uncharacterized membrane protein
MLVTLPIGLWVFSLVCDIVFAATGDLQWNTTAYLTLGGGIIGALLAAVPGLFDLLSLHQPVERRTAVLLMALNLAIVVVQAVNFWLRSRPAYSFSLALGISVVAVGALVVSGWLGGQLVHVFGVTQPNRMAGESEAAAHDRLHPRH